MPPACYNHNMDQIIAGFFKNFNLILLAAGIVVGLWTGRPGRRAEQLFRWVILLGAGMVSLYAAGMHIFFGPLAASNIGWETSPFQYEVGVANLGFGLLCVLSFRAGYAFRLAAVMGLTCWLWGNAMGHIRQMIVAGNFAPGNAGPWFWTDVLGPLLLIVLLRLAHSETRRG